ncbi:hypothetical protein [Mycobacteroides salmoniphilum]|uniref:hypothetical protein n=1 Tax=Mycobacteroides salmoniphilum TaxID=404941 RepID=UPI000994876F|nr:hypothetical protein [Mycobacteroides salmoniphilum]
MGRRHPPRRHAGDRSAASPLGEHQVELGTDGLDYQVRRISAARAIKVYRCPGCDHEIAMGVAHVVAWPVSERQDSGAEDRRHWHTPCWSNRANRSPTRRWS